VIPAEVLDWLRYEVAASDRTEQAAREQVARRLEEDVRRIDARIETMYQDKLDGRISNEFFDAKAAAWREQQADLRGRIGEMRTAALSSVDDAIDLMAATSQACSLFLDQPPSEKRRLISTILDRATWTCGWLPGMLFYDQQVADSAKSQESP
jgi:site-specific DNA recombinase